jgi:transposase
MTRGEHTRLVAWRWRLLCWAADDGNVARTCRHFGISRKSFYKWKRRLAEHGQAGLGDRARAPDCSPGATPQEVVSKILYLRQHYHFGAGRIAAYLARFHQIAIATSSVHRILTRHGMPRLPANQKHRPHSRQWRRYEKPQPGHRLQLDVKFLERSRARASVCISSRPLTTAPGSACSRSTMPATSARRSGSSTTCDGGCRFASRSCRRIMARNSSQTSTGISSRTTFDTSTSYPHPAFERKSRAVAPSG